MPRLLLTRPESDNIYWAQLLRSFGIETISSPLLYIESFSAVLNPQDYSGVILTSKHAVAPASDCCDLPAYVVGQSTAAEAREYGFTNIAAVAQTAQELLPLIPPRPSEKPLLYASGEHISVDVVQELSARGIPVRQEIVYRAIAAESLSADAILALREQRIDGVLLFSARTAEIFSALAPRHDVTLFCLSKAIAEHCAQLSQWREVLYPDTPDAEAFAAIIRDYYTN